MGRLSTHVLDTSQGRPAAGVRLTLYRLGTDGAWQQVVTGETNADGRTDTPLLAGDAFRPGTYRLSFEVAPYFQRNGAHVAAPPYLDVVEIRVTLAEADGHYHVPLLVAPWGYTTYRGS
jgi:5-hydroxyisourate hydrolase